jgi:SSS family solute:Na+ symporter
VNDPATAPHSGLEILDLAAVAFYLLVTLGIALWFGRKQKTTEDYFVGGRHVPWFAVGLSILATLFSTISYLGLPGEMIKHGVGFFVGYMAVPLSMLVIFFLWTPFFMRLRLTSAYEYLERRFGYKARLIAATLFVLLRLGWMSMVVYVASFALDGIKGDDLTWLPGKDLFWWIAMVGLIAAVYTAVGGIQAMIWTDVLQCFLLLAGVLLVIGQVALLDSSGPAEWWAFAATHAPEHTTPPVFSWDLTLRVTIVTAMMNNFFWTVCTHGSDQVVLQRYFSTPSLWAARRSYLMCVAAEVTMVALMAVCGLALLAFYLPRPESLPEGMTALGNADKLFPHFLGHQLPAGCAGLVISAFLCDAIQTLEAGVNSITAVVTNDLVPELRKRGWRMLSDLTIARGLSVLITAGVTINALFVADLVQTYGYSIVDLMPKVFNLFLGPLGALFMIGMFLPRCTSRSAIPAVLVGLVVSILWSWGHVIFGTEKGLAFVLAIAVPCLTTLGLAAILGRFVETGDNEPGRKLNWKAVVHSDDSV